MSTFFYQIPDPGNITGNIKAGGQISGGIQTLTPTGTAATIDWNKGAYAIVDLESATGDVTLTLNNPEPGTSYFIEIIQGSTARNVTFPSSVKIAGEVAPYTLAVTATNDAVDSVALGFNGTTYIGMYAQNHG